jgi:hypothetical protein
VFRWCHFVFHFSQAEACATARPDCTRMQKTTGPNIYIGRFAQLSEFS